MSKSFRFPFQKLILDLVRFQMVEILTLYFCCTSSQQFNVVTQISKLSCICKRLTPHPLSSRNEEVPEVKASPRRSRSRSRSWSWSWSWSRLNPVHPSWSSSFHSLGHFGLAFWPRHGASSKKILIWMSNSFTQLKMWRKNYPWLQIWVGMEALQAMQERQSKNIPFLRRLKIKLSPLMSHGNWWNGKG